MPMTSSLFDILITQFPSLRNTVLPESTVIVSKPMHPSNARPFKLVTLLGIMMLVNSMQFPNAASSICVKLLGVWNVTLVNPLQFQNADCPIFVTLLGIVMLVNPVQAENADCPILVTLFPIVTLVKLLTPLKMLFGILVTSSPNMTVVRLTQFLNVL
jgi:hypothetical protein